MNKERLIELLTISLDELINNKDLQSEITEYYKFIYGLKTCSSCKNKFTTYYKKLMIDGVEKMTNKTSLFKLRTDLMVNKISFENGDFISQNQADNSVCIEFLKANPNRISMFEVYPENWMDLIQNNESENDDE